MKAASFGHFCRNWSATWRSMALAWARSGCRKAWRSAAATMLCWVFGTCARALRIQCTRQRCQAAPNTRRIAAFSPSWASEITSVIPWPLGPQRRIERQFRDAVLRSAGCQALMRTNAAVAGEVLLACIIEDEPEEEFGSSRGIDLEL